jgi:3'-phosphoadenosine 5'-phosphosulfate sulfotransferase (PAPS reductase)/FAD synthetase
MNVPHIVAFGGGVDSTAMVIGLVNRNQPIDLILFADTGAERPETYKHILANG